MKQIGSPDLETVSNERAIDDVVERLKLHGANRTQPRREVIRELLTLTDHVSVDELWARLRETGSRVHRATVYRAVGELEQVGVVRRCQRPDGLATFHVVAHMPPHLHLHCQRCGSDTQVPSAVAAPLHRAVFRDFGFTVDAGPYPQGGTCADCAALINLATSR